MAIDLPHDDMERSAVKNRPYGKYGLFSAIASSVFLFLAYYALSEITAPDYHMLFKGFFALGFYSYLGTLAFMSAGFAVNKDKFNWVCMILLVLIPIGTFIFFTS